MKLLELLAVLTILLLLVGGIYSLVMTRNLIRVLVSLEILMKAVTLALIVVGFVTKQFAMVQTFVITLIVVEVVVMVVAMGLVVNMSKHNETLDVNNIGRGD